MERFLADENINAAIVSGLLLRLPELDITTVQAVGLGGASDPELLAWAAEHDRLLLTHDKKTMPGFVYERLTRGDRVSGVIEVAGNAPLRQIIDDLLLIAQCSLPGEHQGMIVSVPL